MKTAYKRLVEAVAKVVSADLAQFDTIETNIMKGIAVFQEEEFEVVVNPNGNTDEIMAAIAVQILIELDKRELANTEGKALLESVETNGLEGQNLSEREYTRELCWTGLQHIKDNMTILEHDGQNVTVLYNGTTHRVTSPSDDSDLDEIAKKVLFDVNMNAYDIFVGGKLTWNEEAIIWFQFYLDLDDYNLKHANEAWCNLGLSEKTTDDLHNANTSWVVDAINAGAAQETPFTRIYLTN